MQQSSDAERASVQKTSLKLQSQYVGLRRSRLYEDDELPRWPDEQPQQQRAQMREKSSRQSRLLH